MRIRWLLIIPLLMPLTSCQTSKNEFTITWQNVDGEVLEIDQKFLKALNQLITKVSQLMDQLEKKALPVAHLIFLVVGTRN